jgi:hypothetical protein
MNSRVAAIEAGRVAVLAAGRDQLRALGHALGVRGLPVREAADLAFRFTVGLPYVRDNRLDPSGREVVRSIEQTLRSGGDCEDLNLCVVGGLLWASGFAGLGSGYYPDLDNPRHVALVVRDGDGVVVVDVVPGGARVAGFDAMPASVVWWSDGTDDLLSA